MQRLFDAGELFAFYAINSLCQLNASAVESLQGFIATIETLLNCTHTPVKFAKRFSILSKRSSIESNFFPKSSFMDCRCSKMISLVILSGAIVRARKKQWSQDTMVCLLGKNAMRISRSTFSAGLV